MPPTTSESGLTATPEPKLVANTSSSDSRTASPQVKPGDASNATSTVERDVANAFKTFVAQERKNAEAAQQRENAEHSRTARVKNKQPKLEDLKRFADSFKLHQPLPLPQKLVKLQHEIYQEWEIKGISNGIPVQAFPDTGSDMDIVSKEWVDCHGLQVNSSSTSMIQLPNNQRTKSIGTVSLHFRFDGDLVGYHRVFQVLPNCLRDFILGRDFLTFTGTLTRFTHRLVKRVCSGSKVNHLMSVGLPTHRIQGSLNGQTVNAIPDTGSDVMLISRRYAERRGFDIKTGENHKTTLEFADGSRTRTSGMVLDLQWKFGPAEDLTYPRFAGGSKSEEKVSSLDSNIDEWDANCTTDRSTTFLCNVHVLDSLHFDVILRKDLLFDAKAFTVFGDCFVKNTPDILAELSVIRDIGKEECKKLYSLSRRFNPTCYLCIKADPSSAEELRTLRELQAEDANSTTSAPPRTTAQSATASTPVPSNGSAAPSPGPTSLTSGQGQSLPSIRPLMPWKFASRFSAARKPPHSPQQKARDHQLKATV
ncbi:hypothetical protein V8E51_011708 [Hyaloscypha variabilis]